MMSIRTSIELQADRCRVVDVHMRSERGRTPAADVHVRSFVTTLPADPRSPDFAESLRRVREDRRLARQATVTVWGLRSTHRLLHVADGADNDVHGAAVREAADDIALLEADGSRARVAVTSSGLVSIGAEPHREVSLTAVSATDLEQRLESLSNAGFDIVRVLTPAMALTAVARARDESVPGETAMYVALAPHATCVAIVRDAFLLLAREIQWGHADAREEQTEPFDTRLAAELRRSLQFFRQRVRATADKIVLCGDIDNLRSLSGTLSAVSGLPVETLDSLSGIDATAVPEPADEFRAHVAALRVAIAAGAEAPPYSNLFPVDEGRANRSRPFVWSLAGGVAAALVLIGIWYGVRRWSAPPAPARDNAPRQAGTVPPAPIGTPADTPRVPATGLNPPAVLPPTPEPEREVVVTSILYSGDRQLAIINGRIARPGDRIGSMSIVEIRPRAIVVESPGRGRRIVSLRVPLARAQ
jgi:Tfp pilus assembly PilM family ATPase